MNAELELAAQCLREIDALRAGVRFYDAASAALARTPEKRRPDFDEWLTERELALQLFMQGRTAAPPDLAQFSKLVSWLVKTYYKDGKAMRFIIWVLSKVFHLSVPLKPPPAQSGDDGSSGPVVSWIFLLAVVALWFATH